MPFLDKTGLTHLWNQIIARLDGKANQADVNAVQNSLDTHTNSQSNPHAVTKTQIGLSNVEDKSSATIRSEITSSNITAALGYTPLDASDTLTVEQGGTGQTSLADTTYTTARYRASSLHSTETTPTTNGVIAWQYE